MKEDLKNDWVWNGWGTVAFIAVLVLGGLAGGCKTATGPKFDARAPKSAALTNLVSVEVTNRLNPEWLQAPTEPFTLGPGDRLEIELFEEAGSRAMTSVGPDGKIYFHLLPGLDVWGLTLGETRDLLQEELARRFYEGKRPQIGITLRNVESKRVWLLGRLQNSGVYPAASPMTLLESISQAGGTLSSPGSPTELADLHRSFVVRDGQLLPVDFRQLLLEGDMTQNIYLQPDDFVYVPSASAREVFVLGAVALPRPVEYVKEITLVSAVAQAGGTIKNAYISHVAIVRGSLTEPKIAVVDYKEIVQGKAPDVRLEARDIVYVPFSPYRTLTKYADLILTTFVRAVAINEGARAVSRNPLPVGVNIGIIGVQ